jgi:hypothetical protein
MWDPQNIYAILYIHTKLRVGCTFNRVERAFYVTEGTISNESTTKEISAAVDIKCTTLLMSSIKNVT